MRILLIQMPFHTSDMPSISLSLLKAALLRAGYACDLAYFNLEFWRRIGHETYSWIAGASPPTLLCGDLVFAPSLYGSQISRERFEEVVDYVGQGEVQVVPAPIIEQFPRLTEIAGEFLRDKLEEMPWRDYDLVGFNTMFQVTPSLAMARLISSLDGAPRIILGGSNCEGEMGEQLHRSFPFIDYVCPGEGEQLIVSLVAAMADEERSLENIPELIWRDRRKTRRNHCQLLEIGRGGAADEHSDYPLDSLPRPKYDDWLQQVASGAAVDRRQLRLPIETSRGCWYGEKRQCLFCALNGKRIAYRRKSPELALEEFRELESHGVGLIQCVDNVLDFRYFDSFLPELAKRDHGCDVFFEIRSNLTRKQLQVLRRCGVYWSQPGIESLSTHVLKLMRKGVTALQNVRFLKHTAEMGISACWTMLYGFPGETPGDYLEMADLIPLISHLQPPSATCRLVRLHRFSPFFNHLDDYGLKNVEPELSYAEIYPFEREVVRQLAYYFRHQYISQPDPASYIGPTAEAVKSWHREVGNAAFVCFHADQDLHLVDTRAVAALSHAVLRGLERAVFEACADGTTLGRMQERVSGSPDEIAAIVDRFLERRWAVELDGRLLTLAVPAPVSGHFPPAMVRDSVRQAYCSRMDRLRKGFMHAPVPGREALPNAAVSRPTV